AHAHEIQSFGRRGKTRGADSAGVQSRSDLLDTHFAERTFHQRANHQPDHLVKEAVAVEIDRDARTFLADTYGIDCSDRPRFGLPAIGGESGKIVGADEMFRGRFQYSEIERAGDMPGAAVLEWRQNGRSPDSVAINFSFRRKARVKIVRHVSTAKHAYGGR